MSPRFPQPAAAMMLVLIAILAAGCSRGTKAEGEWSAAADRRQSFGKLLVVGVSPSYNTRCRFERRLRDAIRRSGGEGDVTCNFMNPEDPLTRDAVADLVRRHGFDGVIATRLVAGSVEVKEGGTRETRARTYVKPVGYGYATDPLFPVFGVPVTYVEMVNEAPALEVGRSAWIASDVFTARDASVVYSIRTEGKAMASPDDMLHGVAKAIAARLDNSGLLR
ncbi:MAG: hypothetical protein FJ197_12065 [Gammaproteobacteria bacterium]|nr:hypothetical protein [Gammaproteobacteria bacterium]